MSSTCTKSSTAISLRKYAITAIAAVVLAAGCGGSSKSGTAPNTPEQRKTDRALGRQAVLKSTDLPAGYKSTPHKSDSSSDTPEPLLRKFAACADVPKDQIASLLNGKSDPKEVEVDSPDFDRKAVATGYSVSFANSVDLERSTNDVTKVFDTFTAKKAIPCWKTLFQSVFETTAEKGTAVRNVEVAPISIDNVGDEAGGLAIRLTVVGANRSVNAYIDIYLAGTGRAGISLLASGIGERADTALATSLLKTVTDRMKGTT